MEETFIAVPVAVAAQVSQILGSLPHDQVAEVLPALRACLTDEHKVQFPPAPKE